MNSDTRVYEYPWAFSTAKPEPGDPRELLGFPEFDFDRVVRLIPELRIGRYFPVMTQTLVLEKPQ